jgi:hypothetical protein
MEVNFSLSLDQNDLKKEENIISVHNVIILPYKDREDNFISQTI